MPSPSLPNSAQWVRIQQLLKPLSRFCRGLGRALLWVLLAGAACAAWLGHALVQWAGFDWLSALGLVVLTLPLLLLAGWCWLLSEIAALPQTLHALYELLAGETAVGVPAENLKAPVAESWTQRRGWFRELASLLGSIDDLAGIVAGILMLANPLSWLLLALACGTVGIYGVLTLVTGLAYLL